MTGLIVVLMFVIGYKLGQLSTTEKVEGEGE
jgi:hypothetical protein